MPATELPTKTSVSILSDSSLFRETVTAWLKRREEIQFVAAAGSMHQLMHRLNGRVAEVLLAHTSVKRALGTELLWDAKTLLPATHLIVLGYRQSEQDLARWIEAGAMAYLEQDVSSVELLATICEVARGRPRCSMSLLTSVLERLGHVTCKASQFNGHPSVQSLSDRELESAISFSAGPLNEQIGRQLGIKKIHGEGLSPLHFRKTPDAARV